MTRTKTLLSMLIAIVAMAIAVPAHGQIVAVNQERINADSLRRDFDKRPYFGL